MDEKLIQQIINQLTNDVNRLNQELVLAKSRLVLATNEIAELKNQLENSNAGEVSDFNQPTEEKTQENTDYQE